MAIFERSIDVKVPVAEAYLLFSDFEGFPSFMEGVESVERLANDRLRWHSTIGGRDEEWVAKVTELAPSSAIAWASESGARNQGRVTFEKLDNATTRVHMHIEYEPEGVIENIGAMLGVVNGRIAGDLHRFKQLVEECGVVRSGWHARRGSVDEVTASDMMDGGHRREARIQRDADTRRD